MQYLTVHYHELALKGGNRPRFERVLRGNLEAALRGLGPSEARPLAGRILVGVEDGAADEALGRVCRVFGVAHAMRVLRLPREPDAVADAVIAELGRRAAPTFRICTRRVDKRYPRTSVDLDREIGARVHEATGVPVRLKGAALEAHVVWLEGEALVGVAKRGGPGGLPVGTGGRVAALMSGGIDSPVAAWRLMKRGCRVDLVHFHSHPLVDRTTQEKARDLAEVLNAWQLRTRLHLVPLARVQTEVRLHCPDALRVVLYRRFMVRIAERIARRRRCGALVTGESLGQVASQTLPNLATVDAVARLPVLRPLIGTDKVEIIEEATRIGTYAISVRPDQDCCRLFVPDHPATRSTPREAEAAEEPLDVEALVAEAASADEVVDLGVVEGLASA